MKRFRCFDNPYIAGFNVLGDLTRKRNTSKETGTLPFSGVLPKNVGNSRINIS